MQTTRWSFIDDSEAFKRPMHACARAHAPIPHQKLFAAPPTAGQAPPLHSGPHTCRACCKARGSKSKTPQRLAVRKQKHPDTRHASIFLPPSVQQATVAMFTAQEAGHGMLASHLRACACKDCVCWHLRDDVYRQDEESLQVPLFPIFKV